MTPEEQDDVQTRELATGLVGCGLTVLAYLSLQILCSAGIAWALHQGFPRIGFWQAFAILLVLGWLLLSLKMNQLAQKTLKPPKDEE